MKKVILFIFVLCMSMFVIACGDNTSGGGGGKPPVEICNHNFFIAKESEASCMSEGMIYYECSLCGEQNQEVLKRLEHEFGDWNVINEATINSSGTEERSCKNCGETESRIIPQLEHEHHYELVNESEGSCEEDAYKEYRCECGDTYTENIASKGHEFGEWSIITNADCFTNGLKERECGVCGHKEEETIVSKGHNIVNGICTICGEEDMSHLTFSLNADQQSYTLIDCNSSVTSVVIPNTYKGLPVTNIKEAALDDCHNITSLTIPFVGGSIEPNYGDEMLIGYIFGSGFGTGESIYGVGYAYAIPSTLSEITVTGGNISDYAFYNCGNLKSLIFEEGVKTIGKNVLDSCFNIENIEFPSTLEVMNTSMHDMHKLKKIDFGHCTELTSLAAVTCLEGLEELILSDSIESFGGVTYCSALKKFNIPSSIKEISQGFFNGCPLITEIEIPDGVTKIGINAFYYSGIVSVTIPSSVKIVEWSAFQDCHNLETVFICEGVENLGDNVFMNCSKLKEIVLPNTIISVGSGAFNGCSSLEKITIPFVGGKLGEESESEITAFPYIFGTAQYPSSYRATHSYNNRSYNFYLPESLKEVTVLGEVIHSKAFYNCSKIEKIVIGNKVKSIGTTAFNACTNLQEIEFTENSELVSIASNAFYKSTLSELVIPASVESIGDYAFAQMSNLSKLEFEDGSKLKSIGTYAFQKCTLLKELVLPASLETLGEYILANTVIESLSLPFFGSDINATDRANLEYYFYTVPMELKTVEVNSGTEVPRYAFSNCYNIEIIKLAASIEKICEYAFYRCDALKSVELANDNNIKIIEEGAFYGCDALSNFEIPRTISEISKFMFYDTGIESITIPNNITKICESAFHNCLDLKNIEFEDNSLLEEIHERAFDSCYVLKNLVLPQSVKIIKDYAFGNCEMLEEINLSESLISLGNNVFSYCYKLKSMLLPISLENIGQDIFLGCASLTELSVPFIGSKNTKEDSKEFRYLFDNDSYTMSSYEKLETVKVTNALYITNNCFNYGFSIKNIEFSDSIEEIGTSILSSLSTVEKLVIPFIGNVRGDYDYYAFNHNYGYSLTNLKDLTILHATSIGENTFYSCTSLETVTLPDMLKEIKNLAFYNCSSLKTINFPNDLETIGYEAFGLCGSLEEVILPESLKTIDAYAFNCCRNIEKVEFKGNTNSIGEYAFHECSNLKELILCDSISSIGEYAFSNCVSLEEVTLPSTLGSLLSYTFENCSSLNNVIIKEGLTSISANAFVNCNSIQELVIPNSVKYIVSGALANMSGLEKLTLAIDNVLGYYFGEEEFQGSVAQNIENIGTYYVPETLKEVNVTDGDIRAYTFANLENITKVKLLDSTGVIYSNAFVGMTSLEELCIDSCVTTVYSNAFNGVGNQLIWINPIIETIRTDAYKGYVGDVITIPNSVTNIEERAFNNLSCEIDWNNALIETLSSKVFNYYKAPSITIPSTVKYLSEETFFGYDGEILWDNPTIEVIGEKAYKGYGGENVILPISAITIASNAFNEYVGESITITENVKEIQEFAFKGFTGEIIWNNPTIEKISSYAFSNYEGTKLVIPDSVKEIERRAISSSTLTELVIPFVGAKLVPDESYSPENVFAYILSGSNLVKQEYKEASTTGEGISKDKNYYVEYYIPASLKKVTVTGGSLGYGAFSGCDTIQTIDVSQCQYAYNYAFLGCSSLKNVKLPEEIDTIYMGMFKDCISLSEFEIPYTVTEIRQDAFRNCSLLKKVVLPENLDSIIQYAFYECYNLKEVYNLSGLEISKGELDYGAIGLYAKAIYNSMDSVRDFIVVDEKYEFYYDKENETYTLEYYLGNDSELILPEYVNGKTYSISDYAFVYATSLEKVSIPNTVERIGEGIFKGCGNISELILPYVGENASYVDASEYTLLGYLFGKDEYDNSQLVSQFIDDPEVTNEYYFPIGLHKITVNGGNILAGAFSNLTSLDSISISGDVKEVGKYSFYKTSITSLDLVEGVERIGDYAFSNVKTLTEVYLAGSIKEIGIDAFDMGYESFETNIAERIVYYYGTIENWFEISFASRNSNPIYRQGYGNYIYKLNSENEWEEVKEIIVPTNITTIGKYQFAGISGYTDFTFHKDIEQVLEGAFDGAGYGGYDKWGTLDFSNTKISTISSSAFANTMMRSIILPNTVTTIEALAFSNNRYLENIGLSNAIETISYSAFAKCVALEEIILPETVKTIYARAFDGCTSLKNVYVPASVTNMDMGLFRGCSSLESLHLPFIGVVEPGTSTLVPNGSNMLGYFFENYGVEGMRQVLQQVIVYENSNTTPIVREEYYYYIPESLKKLTIDRGDLKNGALNNCSMLEEITHNGQEYYYFETTSLAGCGTLKSLTLSENFRGFYYNALEYCFAEVIYFRGTESQWSKMNAIIPDETIVYCNYVD